MKKLVLFGLTCSLLSGCIGDSSKKYTIKNEFNESQAQQQLKPGNSKIIGNAFLMKIGGGLVNCAGSEVRLIPYTDYANEILNIIYGNTESGFVSYYYLGDIEVNNENPKYKKLTKVTICDSQGNFKLENLSEGSYFVVTDIMGNVGYSKQGGFLSKQGGFLMQKIILKKDETREIILSR